jgi:hypothetical protein
MEENKFKVPTETIELPSQGLLYPESHPLSSGKLEMKYMTAREEDILTNSAYIKQGTVIDKLLQSLIVTKFDYNDLLVGDKNSLMIAARVLAYGKDYEFNYDGTEQKVDLSLLNPKPVSPELKASKGANMFNYTLPDSGNVITFKLLTHGDEQKIDAEVKGLKKLNKDASNEGIVRLCHMIIAVNGDSETKSIRDFVNNYLLAKEARAFRQYYASISPDIDLTTSVTNSRGAEEDIEVPITINFFWPDARV